MYGLSGASGKYPCLWCNISNDELCLPKSDRKNTPRTADTLKKNLAAFIDEHGSNLSKAKLVNNVISNSFFDIPLENVCIPGLHITLGVYMKLLKAFELFTTTN